MADAQNYIKSLSPSILPEINPNDSIVDVKPQVGLAAGVPVNGGGGDDDPMGKEMKVLYNRSMKFDNKPVIDIVRNVAQKMGANPSMLFSSAFQEGMNQQVLHPDTVSEAYNNAKIPSDYPVDGFNGYGLDTFGDKYNDLKKYLPSGFDQRFKTYRALNDSKTNPQWVTTAAFKTNEDALTAKAAMLRSGQDFVQDYAKQKGIALDPKAANYFTLAAYNGGEAEAKKMLDEYMSAKDKNKFISEGQTSRKTIHKNIIPRLKNMDIANQLLNQKSS